MVDTCLHAVEWTLNENTTRIEKNQSISKDKDSIFIRGKCEEQEVRLTYIFNDDSNFQIDDPNLNLTVQAFTENKECQVNGKGQEGSKAGDKDLKIGSAVSGFVVVLVLMIVIFIVVIVIRKRNVTKKEDLKEKDENPIYGLYATNSQENLRTESVVIDENDYYGT